MPKKTLILICDDEIWIRQMVENIVNNEGYESISFENGKLALESILKAPPDLIISDIQMPEMNGIELLAFLENKKVKIPVIFLTGSLDQRDLQKAVAIGHFDYLNKPIKPLELLEAIQKALLFGYQDNELSDKFKQLLVKNHNK